MSRQGFWRWEPVLRLACLFSNWTNVHGNNAAPDDKTRHARFPHTNLLPVGEGANESLREFHVNQLTCMSDC
ncbi:hypothetical protein NTG1052_350071 [Candidatus Nitrotoga sp. 1052]|nr:hypothetical protein NTG1052_350071 [Candidatus Nitrotoga sp. 1052]